MPKGRMSHFIPFNGVMAAHCMMTALKRNSLVLLSYLDLNNSLKFVVFFLAVSLKFYDGLRHWTIEKIIIPNE